MEALIVPYDLGSTYINARGVKSIGPRAYDSTKEPEAGANGKGPARKAHGHMGQHMTMPEGARLGLGGCA